MSARKSNLTTITVVLVLVASPILAGERSQKQSRSPVKRAKSKTKRSTLPKVLDPAGAPDKTKVREQRKWLKKALTYQVKSRKQRKEIVKKIDRLSSEQVDQLVEYVKKRVVELERERLDRAKRNLAQARAYRNQLLRRRNNNRGNVGFRPVISNVLTGPSLSAGAVISPDRRRVRLSLNPWFGSLGPVNTFNLRTGEVRRIYTPPRQRRRRPPQITHDGLRTRVRPADSIRGRRRR